MKNKVEVTHGIYWLELIMVNICDLVIQLDPSIRSDKVNLFYLMNLLHEDFEAYNKEITIVLILTIPFVC